MTVIEKNEYDKLSPNCKRAYDRAKSDHPEWSHSQIIAFAKINGEIENKVGEGGDISTPEVLRDCLLKAKDWLKAFANVSVNVLSKIDDAISRLGLYIARGVRTVGDKIASFLEWLFS